MAYARYSSRCEWYIFWNTTREDHKLEMSGVPKPKEEETLAIWHCAHRKQSPLFIYAVVQEMIVTGDFSRIPGFVEQDRKLLLKCLSEFIRDVDEERASRCDGPTDPS